MEAKVQCGKRIRNQTMKTVICDYGVGNLKSLYYSVARISDCRLLVTSDSREIEDADRLILPGVGAFPAGMQRLNESELISAIKLFRERERPLLGICLGMQLLLGSSEEMSLTKGLGFVDGHLERFWGGSIRVPHVGFNQVAMRGAKSELFEGINDESDFYFTHSYRLSRHSVVLDSFGLTDYGGEFVSFFQVGNIAGCQFHPELSQANGSKLLKNFLRL